MVGGRGLVGIVVDTVVDSRPELELVVCRAGGRGLDERSFELVERREFVDLLGVHGSSRWVVLRQEHGLLQGTFSGERRWDGFLGSVIMHINNGL